MKILLSSFLLGVTSAEIGEQTPAAKDKVKLLVQYTDSLGKFSSPSKLERSINPLFDEGENESAVDIIAKSARPISVRGRISQVEVEGNVDSAIDALLADEEVVEVELDYPMYKFDEETQAKMISSSDFDSRMLQDTIPYGISLVQAPQLWSAKRKPTPIKVCIVDTGYDKTHIDLPKGGITSTSTNFENAFSDGDGHGTHIAGIIGALGNEDGVVGVNPNSKTFSFHISKVLGDDGRGSASTVIEGVEGCLEAGARVITLSLGGGKRSKIQESLFKKAYDDGVLVFAASGNSGSGKIEYPASYPYVISVAAVDGEEVYAGFSNFNDQVELVGPGVNIRSTLPGDSYGILSGTSMAAPHVAGAAALLWSFFPKCSNNQIRNVLALTAKDVSPSSHGCNNKTGFGLIQVKSAYDLLETFGCEVGGLDTLPLSENIEGGCHHLPPKPESIAAITGSPTAHPTRVPSRGPTFNPTRAPSVNPSSSPSKGPSASPSFRVFREQVLQPSLSPTVSLVPNRTDYSTNQAPYVSPPPLPSQAILSSQGRSPYSLSPSLSARSPSQIVSPTISPTRNPSASPSPSRLPAPSKDPTRGPSGAPSSSSPSYIPSRSPLNIPSASPSSSPTRAPSTSPLSHSPSASPSTAPTTSPSYSPTLAISANPTETPSDSQSKLTFSGNCSAGEIWFGVDFVFDADATKLYWFLLDKCTRNIVFDCQDCHATANPYSTHSFGGCIPDAGYVFYFNDYSGRSWSEGGYVLTYDGTEILDKMGNVSSSEEVLVGSQKECPQPPTLAPSTSAPTASCDDGEERLDIQFNFDEDPSGVYWFLIDKCVGRLIHDCQACYTGVKSYSSKPFSQCLPEGHYSFIFNDYSGKEWSQGGYTVTFGGSQGFDSTGNVKHSQIVSLGNELDCPGPLHTASPQSSSPTSATPTLMPTSTPTTQAPVNHSTGCPAGQVRASIVFNLDSDPSKIYWFLIDRCAGTLVGECQGCYSGSEPDSSKYFYKCLPDSNYSFIFNDYSGSKWSQSGYTISYKQTEVLGKRGNIEPFHEVKFGQESCQQPTPQPSTSPSISQSIYCEQFKLDIVTDGRPTEISWHLKQILGDKMDSMVNGPAKNEQYASYSVYIGALSRCLPPGEYEFSINDEGNDGIDNPGYYKIYLNGVAIREGTNFGSVETTGFIVSDKNAHYGIFYR